MKFEIGAMTVGDILDHGLKILLSRLPAFYVINFIVLSPVIALQLAAPALYPEATAIGAFGQRDPGQGLATILTLLLQPIATAASLYIITQEFIDRTANVDHAFRFALRRFWPLLWSSFLAGLVMASPFILWFIAILIAGIAGGRILVIVVFLIGFLIAFGFFVRFLVWYAFVGQVVVVEGLAGIKTLRRSQRLTRNFWWRIFGLLLLLGILLLVVLFIVGFFSAAAFPAYETINTEFVPLRVMTSYNFYALEKLLETMATILVQAYGSICLTLLYFDLRIRKEGFDLEVAAQREVALAS